MATSRAVTQTILLVLLFTVYSQASIQYAKNVSNNRFYQSPRVSTQSRRALPLQWRKPCIREISYNKPRQTQRALRHILHQQRAMRFGTSTMALPSTSQCTRRSLQISEQV